MNLTFSNFRGDTLSLVDNDYFVLTEIDGQTAINTSISSISTGGYDGDTVNAIQAQPRTLILTLQIKSTANVEEAKTAILSVIKIKKSGTIYWSQNDNERQIEGIVEAIEMPRWTNDVLMQITLYCSQPYWEAVDYVVEEIQEAIDLHYFTESPDDMLYFLDEGIPLGEYDIVRTKTLHNAGDVAVGIEMEIVALSTVTNPIIYNGDGDFFGIGTGTGSKKVVLSANDIITISTGRNKKYVKLNGTNIFSKVKPNSTWLQLEAGDNTFHIDSDDESIDNMSFSMTYKPRYI